MPTPTARASAPPSDEAVRAGRAPRPLLVWVDRGRVVEQRLHDPPGLLHAVLPLEAPAVADQRGVQQHLVWGRAFAPLLRELQVEAHLLGLLRIAALGVDPQPDPRGGVEPHDELV